MMPAALFFGPNLRAAMRREQFRMIKMEILRHCRISGVRVKGSGRLGYCDSTNYTDFVTLTFAIAASKNETTFFTASSLAFSSSVSS